MATRDATAAVAAPRAVRAAAALERVRWLSVLRVMLGALFVSVFFENLNKHQYEAKGYDALIGGYRAEGNAPGQWKDFAEFSADHRSFFPPARAVLQHSPVVRLVLEVG